MSVARQQDTISFCPNRIMEDLSSAYNNAGARIMETRGGNRAVALELFRAALECMRLTERQELAAMANDLLQDPIPEDDDDQTVSASEDCLRRADMIMRDLDSYLVPGQDQPSAERESASFAAPLQDSTSSHINAIILPIRSRGYDPYVYARPFCFSTDNLVLPHIRSGMIVFNLGLAHQVMNTASLLASNFYELSASMVSSMPLTLDTILLRLALLNNLGVWSFENGDGESMCTCMEHMDVLVETARGIGSRLDPAVFNGMRDNIHELLAPSHGGSPAA
jgi:hypothetical protein